MYRVLITDAQPIVRLGVKFLINQLADFTVVSEQSTGLDAWLRIERGDIDLVLLGMPSSEDGLATIKRIHDCQPTVRIVVFTGNEEPAIIGQAIYYGALGYVFKTSAASELIQALKQTSGGHRYLDNNIMVTKKDLLAIKGNSQLTTFSPALTLSKREQEIFPFIVLGYTNKEIAGKLFISTKTVEAHKANIMHKLHLDSQAQLIRYALHHHLINF